MGLKSFNKVTVVGYVTRFSIYNFKSGKRKAEIGIKDELTNNICYVQMFENDNMTYGGSSTNLDALNHVFMDNDGKPRHVLVKAIGKVAENSYISTKTNQTVVSTKPTIWKIDPCDDIEEQQVVFVFAGVIDNLKLIKDDSEAVIRLAIPVKNKDKEFTKLEYITCTADGEILEMIEDNDVEKGCQVNISGDILNRYPKRDRYGRLPEGGQVEKGFKIVMLGKKFIGADELDEDLYKQLKVGVPGVAAGQNTDSKIDESKDTETIDGLDF